MIVNLVEIHRNIIASPSPVIDMLAFAFGVAVASGRAIYGDRNSIAFDFSFTVGLCTVGVGVGAGNGRGVPEVDGRHRSCGDEGEGVGDGVSV